ncbi:MAG: histidine kinase [Bryobacterales bacterium]|nr:histidine kinase [Bryobacterales bacterium]
MSNSSRTEVAGTELSRTEVASNGRKGKLKVFLGFAAGVGKTYQMLVEAREQKREGVDVVVGYFEPHGRRDTMAQIEGLEIIPRRKESYRGTTLEEMDADAILARRPKLAVVDEFPHTNAPGSARAKRWQDVMALLDAGIDVFTTMNIQHLESLNDQVFAITGIRVRETIPDWVIKQAAEVVMVDLTPRALLNRLARGVVYAPDKAQRAKENFFREPALVALRELALRETAHEVDQRHVSQSALERILVFITSDESGSALIRRGKRVADYLRGECIAVATSECAKSLELARGLQIEAHVLEGGDLAEAVVDFARRRQITQIYMARPSESHWQVPFRRELIEQITASAREWEVTIVANRNQRDVGRNSEKG